MFHRCGLVGGKGNFQVLWKIGGLRLINFHFCLLYCRNHICSCTLLQVNHYYILSGLTGISGFFLLFKLDFCDVPDPYSGLYYKRIKIIG